MTAVTGWDRAAEAKRWQDYLDRLPAAKRAEVYRRVLAASDAQARIEARVDAAYCEGYRAAETAAFHAGYERAYADIIGHERRHLGNLTGPSHADLERRRHFLPCPPCRLNPKAGCPDCRQRTRATYGLPMHGDFAGHRGGISYRHECCPPCRADDHAAGCADCKDVPWVAAW